MGRRGVQDRLDALTDEERTVLSLLAEGLSDDAIGQRTSFTPSALENHLASIFTKLGLEEGGGHERVQAVLAYLRD